MKNKILKYLACLFLFSLISNVSYSDEPFNFDVTEVEILQEGNLFKGLKKGTITSDDGIIIDADQFEYNKEKNILTTDGNVKLNDTNRKIIITTDNAIYFKNKELIYTYGNSKAIDENGIVITADNFEFNKFENLIKAYGNVKINNPVKDYLIYSEKISYFKNFEKIISTGKTKAIVKSRYIIDSSDVNFLIDENNFSSEENTSINDQKSNFYYLEKFNFDINEEILKGEDIVVITNFGLPKSDQMYFSTAMINFQQKKFLASDTTIKVDKNIFNNRNQDPRLKGVSSRGIGNKTFVNKGIFTSCNDNDECPPWVIESENIIHDKDKRQITYNNAILKVYNLPVLYFPKFFHPDPTVERQSGFLRPQLNESSILGTSLYVPYFKVISDNKDLTLRPKIFDSKIYMIQTEYRQENENSSFIADFGLTKGYKSSLQNDKNSLIHFFTNFSKNLKLDNYETSTLNLSLSKVSNDTYLKVFDNSLSETPLSPSNKDILSSSLKIILDNEKYNFDADISMTEDLNKKNSDRYTYTFPSYSFNKNLLFEKIPGVFTFDSTGSNHLKNTNNLTQSVYNNFKYNSNNYISKNGFMNNFKFYYKNSNIVSKKDPTYKNSPTIRFANIYEISSSWPLYKRNQISNSSIIPKISYRINPNGMNDMSGASRRIDINNIFNIDRLSISEAFEEGQSLTLGLNYINQNFENDSKRFEASLATVLRDKVSDKIPTSSTINQKGSDIFGSINNSFSENLSLNYKFSMDNNLNKFHYNSISSTISLNNFVTTFNFVEENSSIADTNTISNSTSYQIDENNFLTFSTRRNRKIDLTEFYDLVYEYKNDCLIAGLKFRKTYYQDREVKPKEDILLTLTLIPLTTYEQRVESLDFNFD